MENLVVVGVAFSDIIRIIDAINDKEKKINFLGFIDDKDEVQGKSFWGYPVLGKIDWLIENKNNCLIVNTVARTTKIRKFVHDRLKKLKVNFTTLVHPDVDMRYNQCGVGVVICPGSKIGPNAVIGDQVMIGFNSVVGHDTEVGMLSFIAGGATVLSHVEVGEGVFFGSNSSCFPRVKIGSWSTVGMCSAVMTDVKPGSTVIGNIARPAFEK